MQWYWVDLAILGVIALSVVTGLIRGFIKELIALGVWVAAIWIAFNYSHSLDPWLEKYIVDSSARAVAGFVLLLVGIIVTGGIINALFSFILQRSGLSGTDRLLGMGFGFVRGVFLVGVILSVVQMTSLPYQDYAKNSKLYAHFDPVVSWISGFMPNLLTKVKAINHNEPVMAISQRLESES